MPDYMVRCKDEKCDTHQTYFRQRMQPEPYPPCTKCGGPSKIVIQKVAAPMDWDAYNDPGLGIRVDSMKSIDDRLAHLAKPQKYRDSQTGEIKEVPGTKFVNAGRMNGA